VIGLGGSALLRRGERAEAAVQRNNVLAAAAALAAIAETRDLVITHGNAPQVGLLAVEADAYKTIPPYPLDMLGAESQGLIGYLLVQALRNDMPGRGVAAVVTQTVVDPSDEAFARPSKPIGPTYSEREARELARDHDWSFAADGAHVRRIVASPRPEAIVELDEIDGLLAGGAVVVCAGGGGIPVVREGSRLRGIEAVVDKDATAALLAEAIGARRLVLATDVRYVERGWGTPEAAPIERASPALLRNEHEHFAPGSMEPKVAAACRFVERTGGTAAIGALDELADVARGRAGTQIELQKEAART